MRHVAKKRFGQNFLIDEYLINRIIDLINPKIDEEIIEIGPGFGALTTPILARIPYLNVIEIDRDIIAYLKQKFDKATITIYEADALKFDFSIIKNKFRLIGNLPYNISTPLLFHVLNKIELIIDMHFMLQKEVVERICAKPDTKDYGKLSIMLQLKLDCSYLLDVASNAFNPAPKVDSAIVRLVPKKDSLVVNEKLLNQIVTNAFNQRRKTIANSLANYLIGEDFKILDIDSKKRAENLTIKEYVNITNYIESKK
jgi:16S rRNA (adenine1518-N6/adenine1519-N6)-dimethyltransferase